MSFEGIRKRRRCIVQKLDFENCIVTNFKTTARGRKKLRARITREFEDFSDIPEDPCQQSETESPTSSQRVRVTSPVLIRKQCRSGGSPALAKREKTNSPERELSEHSTIEEIPSSPGSPVFKTYKKQKKANVLSHNGLDETTSANIFDIQGNSNSDSVSSFLIEEFTQESNQSVKISSVESPVKRTDTPSSYSGEVNAYKHRDSPTSNCFSVFGKYESPKPVRKKYKKNSLLGRLHKLQQKQASEKLLWQHQNRKNSINSLIVTIVAFWKEEFNYYFKCQSSDLETTFVVIDSRWVPNVKNIKEGSVLQLHPPWQKLFTEDSGMTVLLSVICLEVLDETKRPILPKKTFEMVPAERFEANWKLFIESFFSSCGPGYLF